MTPQRSSRALARVRRLLVLLAAVGLGWLTPANVFASKVDDLAKLLLDDDSSYKVRLQAAVLMGKLGDPVAVPSLVRALTDSHKLVRGTAAQSLGRLGGDTAAAALRGLLQRERDTFVRQQVEKALAAIETPAAAASAKKIYLRFGTFAGGTRGADAPMLDILRGVLQRELGKLPTVGFTLDGADERTFAKSGRMGFLIDGNVTRLDAGSVGGAVEINCDVKVMVARWPSKSIILWTNAGAAVQGGARERDQEFARRDCIEASAGQLGEDLAKFFRAQGG